MQRITLLLVTVVAAVSAIPGAIAEEYDWPYRDVETIEATRYINPEAAIRSRSPLQIETYEDRVPDTLDIADRIALAVNVLTSATNRKHDHEMYFSCYLGNPLRMSHNFSDWCTPKFMESLALLRPIVGNTKHSFVDATWQNVLLKSIGPDGLYYFPIQGKPWYGKELWWGNGVARADGSVFTSSGRPKADQVAGLDTYATSHADFLFEQSGITQFAHPQPSGRILNVLNIYYLESGDSRWTQISKRMVDRLLELAVDKGDYCYFPAYYFEPNAKYDSEDPRAAAPSGLQGGEINGRCIQGPALLYQLTGYEPARELAQKLTKFMRFHDEYYGPEGQFIGDLHYHAHTTYLHEMLQLAMATNDRELLDFVRTSFEWAKTPQAGMSTLTGFTPEFSKPYKTSEGCAVADMVALALKLSHAGAGDYYEDAERWTRNHFAEMQLTEDKLADVEELGRASESKKVLYNETTDHVGERNLGAFASWATGNEWIGGDERGSDNLIMHCCTGNATRTLYYIWRHMIDIEPGLVRVNMLLNRASPAVDIYSCIPHQGLVQVKLKRRCPRLLVHAPEWIETGSDEARVTVDGQPRDFEWDDRYLDLGEFAEPKLVEIRFPIAERSVTGVKVGLADFNLVVRGNTVVSIDPPGSNSPLYERERLRSDDTPWRRVMRVAPESVVAY